jgi:FkbM family methyltransferase|tara:strand:+ start:615 stop:1382 length:768 start_codon:yes stop_codon:yes gene_type:complete
MTDITSTNMERTAEYLAKFNREKVLKHIIKDKAPVIFDVGANSGMSLEEFKGFWSDSTVHCFEPQKECWTSLHEKSKKYQESSVFINKTAVGKKVEKDINFYSHEINTGLSGFNKINLDSVDSVYLNELQAAETDSNLNKYSDKINHKRLVNVIRLDEYMSSSKIEKVNLLKIDTQGFEPEVLAGLGKRLEDVDVVVTELMFYDYYSRSLSFSDIEKYLIPSGFQLYDISHIAKNPMNGRTDWIDVIYVNNKILL